MNPRFGKICVAGRVSGAQCCGKGRLARRYTWSGGFLHHYAQQGLEQSTLLLRHFHEDSQILSFPVADGELEEAQR